MPRRVLITGASRGIGKAIAEVYKREGWETLTPTRAELCLGESGSAYEYKKKHGTVDALIHSAAINTWESAPCEITNVNYSAAYDLLQQFVEAMSENEWGRIVCLSSCSALLGRGIGRAPYSASKAAVDAVVRCLASTYSRDSVLVNSVCPGFVNTDMTNQNLTYVQQKEIKKQIPIGRFAQPAEIAEFVYFLGSEKNTYITGQVIPIDGGYTTCR